MKIQEIIGQRIAENRKKCGLTLKALAELSKGALTASCVANWERGARTPGPNEAILLGKLLNTAPSYLLGLSDTATGEIRKLSTPVKFVPLLSLEQATNPLNSIETLKIKHSEKIEYAPLTLIENDDEHHYFAIKMQDDSMSPKINTNDIVIINTDQKPKPGSLVAAVIPNQPGIIIRQYKQHSFNNDFEAFELTALNDNWANIIADKPDAAHIVGIICQSTHLYQG